MNTYRLNLLVKISQAKHAGLTHFAAALTEIYRKEFANKGK